MATIFKSLAPSDYTITPFPTYYEYSYAYVSGGMDNSPDVQFKFGTKYPSENLATRLPNAEYELYDSIVQTFYSSSAVATYGMRNGAYIPSESLYVVSITQDLYGNTIVPGTFGVTINSTKSIDDGIGNIWVSSSGVANRVGFVFYDMGIAVLQPTASTTSVINNGGLYVGNGDTIDISFTATLLAYEHAIRVKINPNEFLYAMNNPTVQSVVSGSKTALDLMYAKTILPYQTAVGLYNKNNELLAVAKVSNPIQRTSDMPQTFIIKFDT